jgi:glycosyltransferase involved in cell wall biosynthesis
MMTVMEFPQLTKVLHDADLTAAWLVAAIWVLHLLQAAFGMRTIADIDGPECDLAADAIVSSESGQITPKVTIVVPARNEAHTIEPALRSLRRLDYPNYEVIALNDRSEDTTGDIMRRVAAELEGAPVKVVNVTGLPTGWLGKTHAMWRGAQEGSGEWILFTDADVVFRKDALRRAVAYAEKARADHFVLFPTMIIKSPGEQMMMAVFQTLIGFGHRPWKVADPKARDYIGIGAFNMVRSSVYKKLGTYESMKLAIIDDMQLGAIVKQRGFRQRVAFGKGLASIHWASGTFGIMRNLSKNFFAYVRFNTVLALMAAFGLLFLNVLPFAGLILASGWAWVGYAVAVLCIFAIYIGMSRRSDIAAWYIITHPVSSTLIAYTILLSMFHTLRNGGVLWRGTLYPLDELRKGM